MASRHLLEPKKAVVLRCWVLLRWEHLPRVRSSLVAVSRSRINSSGAGLIGLAHLPQHKARATHICCGAVQPPKNSGSSRHPRRKKFDFDFDFALRPPIHPPTTPRSSKSISAFRFDKSTSQYGGQRYPRDPADTQVHPQPSSGTQADGRVSTTASDCTLDPFVRPLAPVCPRDDTAHDR